MPKPSFAATPMDGGEYSFLFILFLLVDDVCRRLPMSPIFPPALPHYRPDDEFTVLFCRFSFFFPLFLMHRSWTLFIAMPLSLKAMLRHTDDVRCARAPMMTSRPHTDAETPLYTHLTFDIINTHRYRRLPPLIGCRYAGFTITPFSIRCFMHTLLISIFHIIFVFPSH